MADTTEVIQAAMQVVMRPALRLMQMDPHQWSDRPCPTCRSVTAIVGEPFGCYYFQQHGRLRG